MTTQALATNGRAMTLASLDEEQRDVLRKWVAPTLDDNERQAFLAYCNALDADPFGKEIYAWKDKGKIVTHLAIDFLRRRAGESKEYEGQIGPEYTDDGEKWLTVWLKKTPPAAVRIGVLRRGFRAPLWGISVLARDKRDIPGPWQTNPTGQMEVTAERRCLKRGFPREMAGIEHDVATASRSHGYEVAEGDYVDAETGEIAMLPGSVADLNAEQEIAREKFADVGNDSIRDTEPVRSLADIDPTNAMHDARPQPDPAAWKTDASQCWEKVKAWAKEHGTDASRLRFYLATDKGVPQKLTESAFKAWLDAAPGRDFDQLYVLYVDGERNPVAGDPDAEPVQVGFAE